MPFTLDFMLLVALSIEVESRSLQENLSQKESSDARLPYDKQIRKEECEKQDLEERLRRTERPMIYCPGQLYITVSKEQLNEDRSQLRDRETKLENVETQPRELQELFSGLEELKERATKRFWGRFDRELRERRELREKFKTLEEHNERRTYILELNELEGEPRDGEQHIVQLKRDLLKIVTKLENVETQPRELQELFSGLEELKERATKRFWGRFDRELRERRELREKFKTLEEHNERRTYILELNELEGEPRDGEQHIVQLKRDLLKIVTKLENVETQPRELQEQFSILEELKERETKFFRENVQTQLRELPEKFTILEEHRERETCTPQDE